MVSVFPPPVVCIDASPDGNASVPKPRPGVFRITKNVHNILQGVSHPDQRISKEEKDSIIDWISENANRYWFSEGGPLRPPEEGGADVVMVRCFPSPSPSSGLPLGCRCSFT